MSDVKTVFVFPNGNVAVCGSDGKQIPELQGQNSEELLTRIAERASPATEWNFGEPA